MKKILLVTLGISLLLGILFAQEMVPAGGKTPVYLDHPGLRIPASREVPVYTFTVTPTALMTSYYDFMIGSYNGIPLRAIPESAGGGYFMTYHGRRQPTATRRAFYAYIDAMGNIVNNNEISYMMNNEGYSTLAVDPVSGKPLYAWHANGDADAQLEIQFSSDAFISQIAGLFNDVQNVVNNPFSTTSIHGATADNEFIWPTAQIGPSPVAGKRRIYLAGRNSVTHNHGPSENPIFAYADFNANDLENGIPLVWNYTFIPEMNDWNNDQGTWRRPFHAITTDNAGNVYYAGYHFATTGDGVTTINEPDMDVFKCNNYGQGTWTRVSASGDIPSWNPPESPTSTVGYFDDNGVPYQNSSLSFNLANSSHLNATVDSNGKIHVPAIWAYSTDQGTYFPNLQFVKEFVYDPTANSFSINEIYPRKNPADTHNACFTPWDREAPWGVVDQYNPDGAGGFFPTMATDWPFPHWDAAAHTDAMMFHYNNIKISEANSEQMMATVWQNSWRALQYNRDSNPDYAAFANVPEIYISVSPNNGGLWSEPIVLNNVEVPAMSGIKPMWVYPADKIKYMGMQGNKKVGKLGLMFYNDYTWGSNAISPPYHPTNDGGQIMFMELQIVFPESGTAPTDPFGSPLVLSGSMSVMAGVMVDNQMASSGDVLAAYVNVAGVPQLRGKGTVQLNNAVAGCLLQVFTESNGENIYFKVWDASSNNVLDVTETLPSQVNGTVGSWPNDLFWLHAGSGLQQSISLQTGWNLFSLNVHPANMAISSIFGNIIANVQMLKSPQGVYEPGNPYSTLSQLNDSKAYYVKVSQSCTLAVEGSPIDLSIPIALQTGWNWVGYTPRAAMPVATAIASIASNLIQVKGTEGIYEPTNPYSTLINLSPGKAYWMMMSSTANLIYPASGRISDQALASAAVLASPVIKTNSQSVLISLDTQASSGDVLMAYVGAELRGITEIISVDGRLGALLQIFSDTAGEQVQFSLLRSSQGSTIALEPALQTVPGSIVGDYAEGIYYILNGDQTDVPELKTSLGKAYPNPFSQGTNISLNVGKDAGEIKVEIFNLRGQKVKTLLKESLSTGSQKLWWDGLDDSGRQLASGVYFCRLQSSKINQNVKLILVK